MPLSFGLQAKVSSEDAASSIASVEDDSPAPEQSRFGALVALLVSKGVLQNVHGSTSGY